MGHHYVPRFYLKNFAFNFNEKKLSVYSMTKEGKIPSKPNQIGDISQEKNYNTKQQESDQAQLEKRHSVILEKFIETPIGEKFDAFDEFINFVSFMMANNVSTRIGVAGALHETLKEKYGIIVNSGHKKKLPLSCAISECIFEELQTWQFIPIKKEDNEKIFITSDNPVSMFYPINPSQNIDAVVTTTPPKIIVAGESVQISKTKVSIGSQLIGTFESVSFGRDVIMIFPVTPSQCLIGFSDRERYEKYIKRPWTDEDMAFINHVTFSKCLRVAYSCSKQLLEATKANMRHQEV